MAQKQGTLIHPAESLPHTKVYLIVALGMYKLIYLFCTSAIPNEVIRGGHITESNKVMQNIKL